MIGALVLLVNVPEILEAFVPEANPEIPEIEGADQEYKVPDGIVFPDPSVGATSKATAEQAEVDCAITIGV